MSAMLNTPERRRYNNAHSRIKRAMEEATAASEKEALRQVGRDLSAHHPDDEEDPDCDRCGTPWPCSAAERAMRKVRA
ncbi:hypothetical protein ACWEP8_36825 [Streptomyces hydrogenans]